MAFPSIETGMSRSSSSAPAPPSLKTRSRTQSISSDRPSTIAYSIMSPPLSVSPEAAFIAASAASQIVTNDHDSHADTWYDQHGIEPSSETSMVSQGALVLVNNWLDQLLFNFLSVSRSTSLSALRPAVSEVLKPKLAKDAMNQADEELREYLGGGDDEEEADSQDNRPGSPRDWDLELVWKRTRLRCMVYSSLGDMEEEDEDYHMEREHLEDGDESADLTVSPAVAIFLTSILEFMGEQALIIAGQAAYHRLRNKFEKQLKDAGSRHQAQFADRIVVEELDMERVALDRTLGRLWRAWKKRIRSPTTETPTFQRTFSRDSMRLPLHQRQSSLSAQSAQQSPVDRVPEVESATSAQPEKTNGVEETVKSPEEILASAAAIALPENENDLMEIIIPGLACQSDDEDSEVEETESWTRPKSLMILPHALADLPTPTMSQPHTPVLPTRKRSNSLPTPAVSPYASPKAKSTRPAAVADKMPESTNEVSQAPSDTSVSEDAKSDAASETEDDDETETVNTRTPTQRVTKDRPASIAIPKVAAIAQSIAATDSESEDDQAEEDHTAAFDFNEEPEILTGSRVSLSGRSSSPSASDGGQSGRRVSIVPGFPMRSSSVHSLRVIDVGPRSPGIRPLRSPAEIQPAGHHHHANNLSRASSISVTRALEDRLADGEVNEGRRGSVLARPPMVADPETIAETAEQPRQAARYGALPQGVISQNAAQFEIIRSDTPPAKPEMPFKTPRYSPTKAMAPPPKPEPKPEPQPVTKVTIIKAPTTTSGTFFVDDDLPEPEPQAEPEPPRPALPLRSSSREAAAQIKAQDVAMSHRSVDRPSTAKQSPTSPRTMHKASPKTERSSPARARDQAPPPQTKSRHHAAASSVSSSKFKTVRASEETPNMRSQDLARNFEELIQSDQTIQYTLTPESMRDMDSIKSGIESPMQSKSRRSGESRQAGTRSRSSSGQKSTEIRRTPSLSRTAGLSSHPVESHATAKLSGPIPRSMPAMPGKSRSNGPQARDARVPRESILDFADFIRATGPSADSISMSPASRVNGANGIRTASGPLPTVKSSMESGRPSTNSTRARYQARDPTVDYKDDNSDLIDFIRRGPPQVGGNPRIPRSVAPFRSTMDSDQLTAAVGGRAVDAQLPDIRNSGTSASVTENSSMHSSSALLKKDRPAPQQQQKSNMFDGADMMPKRKTRRVKDPYAIDDSDDDDIAEEEEYQSKPKRAQTNEESLIDFLKHAPPPPPEPVQPLRTQQLNKKKSAPSLMSRFTRNGSSGGSFFSMSSSSPSPRRPSESTRSLNSRSGASVGGQAPVPARGYTPIQVNIPGGADKYSPGYTSSPLSSDQARPTGRVPMKRYEARDAQPLPSSRATNDLAEFLRSSGPPDMGGPVGGQRSPPAQEDSGAPKFFRRKKNSIA